MRNRFKGLDMIDRLPDELWTEVHDIVQDFRSKEIENGSLYWKFGYKFSCVAYF